MFSIYSHYRLSTCSKMDVSHDTRCRIGIDKCHKPLDFFSWLKQSHHNPEMNTTRLKDQLLLSHSERTSDILFGWLVHFRWSQESFDWEFDTDNCDDSNTCIGLHHLYLLSLHWFGHGGSPSNNIYRSKHWDNPVQIESHNNTQCTTTPHRYHSSLTQI